MHHDVDDRAKIVVFVWLQTLMNTTDPSVYLLKSAAILRAIFVGMSDGNEAVSTAARDASHSFKSLFTKVYSESSNVSSDMCQFACENLLKSCVFGLKRSGDVKVESLAWIKSVVAVIGTGILRPKTSENVEINDKNTSLLTVPGATDAVKTPADNHLIDRKSFESAELYREVVSCLTDKSDDVVIAALDVASALCVDDVLFNAVRVVVIIIITV